MTTRADPNATCLSTHFGRGNLQSTCIRTQVLRQASSRGLASVGLGGYEKRREGGGEEGKHGRGKICSAAITCLGLRYFLGAWARPPHHASHANAFDFNL